MASLYELTTDYMQLQDMLSDPDIDDQVILDTMESIEGELEDKADNYAKMIRNLTAEMDAFKKEYELFRAKYKARENSIKRLKNNLQASMEATGRKKFKTSLFSYNIAKNPKSLKMDIDVENPEDLKMVPEDFLIPQLPKVNTAALKDALLKEAEDLWGIEKICHLEQGESLRIK